MGVGCSDDDYKEISKYLELKKECMGQGDSLVDKAFRESGKTRTFFGTIRQYFIILRTVFKMYGFRKGFRMGLEYLKMKLVKEKGTNTFNSVIPEVEDVPGNIRVLNLVHYMNCPPKSGGSLRIISPLWKMPSDCGVSIDVVFTTHTEEYAKTCEKYLNEIPVVRFSKGLYCTDYMSELGCPEDIPKDVWKTINQELADYLPKLLEKYKYDIIQVEHSQLSWVVPLLRKYSPNSKILLDAHNLEYRIYETWLPYVRPFEENEISSKLNSLKTWEYRIWNWYDGVFSISSVEKEILRAEGVKNIFLVPTGGGIDPGKYCPTTDSNDKPIDILYIGSMNWYPNAHGLLWFVENVFPIIQEKRPGTNFNVIGSGIPNEDLLKLMKTTPGIKFHGFQEDDVAFFHKSKVFIVPLWIGAGARVKVITAWAAKTPVVSTTFGAEGTSTENGKNILFADEPTSFAESVLNLLEDNDYHDYVADQAFETLKENYTTDKCAELILDAYKEIVNTE